MKTHIRAKPLAVRRINDEARPFALIDPNGTGSDIVLLWRVSEDFAPLLAKLVEGELQG